jgi:transposase
MEADLPLNPSCPGCVAAAKRIAELESRLSKLEALAEQLRRGGKRQAAPFSKGPPKADPKPPGRKAGEDYGTKARRAIPAKIDEVLEAPLPGCCPFCSAAAVEFEKVDHQYQTEIPTRPIHRRFDVHVGRCGKCGRRVQGRHPLQTSDALGAAASQLGPDAQAAVVHLNKQAGLSHGKIGTLFSAVFGIQLTRGGVCQAMLRSAGKCLPQYHQILLHLPQSPWAVLDETGWKVGGLGHWLHVAVTPHAVAFLVAWERGFEASTRLLPIDYAGTLVHDGWSPYLRFSQATHQTCIGHLLRRAKEMLETARGGAVVFPRRIKGLLHEALEVRSRRDAGDITPAAASRAADRLEAQVARFSEPAKTNAINERFAAHLYRQQHHLFAFLRTEGLDATNWRAEQALRNPIVNRKVWGGNRTETGAAAQGILCSIWGTAAKAAVEPFRWLSQLLRSPATTPPLLPDTG